MLFSRIMVFPALILFLISSYQAALTFLLVDYSMKETGVTTALSLFTLGLLLTICWVLINLSSFHVIIRERVSFGSSLKRCGYSKKAVEEIWKWYDPSEKKGAANW